MVFREENWKEILEEKTGKKSGLLKWMEEEEENHSNIFNPPDLRQFQVAADIPNKALPIFGGNRVENTWGIKE